MAWTKRYVRADANGSGNGTTDANSGANGSWTLAQAYSNVTAGTKVIVKGAHGTYANTTTSRTTSVAGTTGSPIWWAGCNNAEDDLDNDFVTARPSITFTSGQFNIANNFNFFSNFDISGTSTSGVLTVSANVENIWFDRCKFENTNATANGMAFSTASSHRGRYSRCLFKATSSASRVVDWSGVTNSAAMSLVECALVGGGDGIRLGHTSALTHIRLEYCTFRAGAHGISDAATAGHTYVSNCSFYGGTDGFRGTAARTGTVEIRRCVFGNQGGYGINHSTGTNSGCYFRSGNVFGLYTSGKENGLGDTPSFMEIDLGATSPFVSSTDLTLDPTNAAAARGIGLAGAWPGESYSSYADRGAIQHQDTGGGAASMMRPVSQNGGLV